MTELAARAPIEWDVVTRCRTGEATSGDRAVVKLLADGALMAGIDGLGHGQEAADAALRAAAVVRSASHRELVPLLRSCDAALRGTRGAAVSLAFVDESQATVTWIGVGNVAGRVLSGEPSATRPKASLALGSGVPGFELPALKAATVAVRPGDVLILATDGIHTAFADALDVSGSTQAISERIVAGHRNPRDDALVVVARYVGARG